MPTNSDLVTDLPADFEVFGQGVDTTLADLKGGTTGQILSKATNADMDFVWTNLNPGDITGVTATSPLTGGGTSGDVTIGIQAASTSQSGAVQLTDSTSSTSTSTAATPNSVKSAYDLAASKGVGTITAVTAGTGITGGGSSGSVSVAFDVANYGGAQGAAGKNLSINGGMDWWQRGTSSSATGYLADRWFNAGSNTTYSQESTAANLPAGFLYGLKMTMTATDTPYAMQAIETRDTIRFAGKRVTLSYYAATSNSTDVTVRLDYSTVANTSVQGSFTQINPVSGNVNQPTTTTMTRVTQTYDVPSTALTLRIIIGSNASLVSGRTVTVTGVQLELGSTATPFSRAGGTIQGELAACQRYYQVIGNSAGIWPLLGGYTTSGGAIRNTITFPVTMRVAPTVTKNGTWAASNVGQPSSVATSIAGFTIENVGTANGIYYCYPDSTDDTFTMSAEL